MINQIAESIANKTIDQYKVIEERLRILTRLLTIISKEKYMITPSTLNGILKAISNEELEIEKEEEILWK